MSPIVKIGSVIGLLFYSLHVFALPSDKEQKIFITADSSIYNYKTGVNLFQGHVRVDQGSTHLTADQVITKNNDQHQIAEALAYGFQNLAHYWTLQKTGDPEIHAQAKTIKYYPLAANAILEKNVYITQGDNIFQGQLIIYNSQAQTITVPASQHGRAVLVYNPDEKK